MTILSLHSPIALTLAQGLVLIAWWKAFILLLPFIPWAKYVSHVFDKHAARFHLNRRGWNAIHMFIALAALALGLGIPAMAGIGGIGGFALSLAIVIVVLVGDLVAYPMIANKDERVPEQHRVNLLDFSKFRQAQEAKAEAKRAGRAELVILKPDKSKVEVPAAETPELAVRIAAEKLFIDARARRASQVDLVQSAKEAFTVAYTVDAFRHPGETIPAVDAIRTIDFWKAAGNLDLAERRKKQTADIRIDQSGDAVATRVTASGGAQGLRLTLLFNPAQQVNRRAEKLGLLDSQLAELKKIVEDRQGVVLLAAPPDGGRTTMFYSVVGMHDAYTSNVQTVELEIQHSLDGVKHNVFDPTKEGTEFSKLVRSILRRDPQVVGVSELDPDTAKEIARADHERTRTYVSIRADSAIMALQVWVKAVEDAARAGECLRGVMAGKVLRKLCENCRQAYQPTPDMLKKLGLPPDKVSQLFRKGGKVLIKNREETCPVCQGIGYAGIDGVFEVFQFGPDERRLIKEGNFQSLRAELRKKQLPTIQQVALRKAVEGVTSVEEVLRITAEPQAKPAGAPPAQAPGAAPSRAPAH